MLTSLVGMLMVLVVSGDDEVTVMGYVGQSVLLPCPCKDRNENEEFKWHIGDKAVLYKNSTFNDSYKDRAAAFVSEDSSNCSIRLDNITADDQEEYRCIFYKNEIYQRFTVNLTVSETYSVHQHPPVPLTWQVRAFQCDVKGRHRETEIEWLLDGQPLTNSSETNIPATHIREDPAGYHFSSILMTKLIFTSEPKCRAKAKGITAVVISGN